MKTITIGRSAECNITIEHELISRKHALLKLYPSGKIEIVDMGLNGTSVNGVKIQPNMPKRINRNDVVTFAGSKSLDWNLVPPTRNWYLYSALATIALVGIGALLYFLLGTGKPQPEVVEQQPDPVVVNPGDEPKAPSVIVIQPGENNKPKPKLGKNANGGGTKETTTQEDASSSSNSNSGSSQSKPAPENTNPGVIM